MFQLGKSFDFDKRNTDSIRGLTAIALVVVHAIEDNFLDYNIIINLIGQCGFLCVAVYFFLSGYGLIFSVQHNDKYLDRFLINKALRLLIPVYSSEILYIIFYLISGKITFDDLIDIVLFWKYVRFSWFVISIGIIYIIFFISFSYVKKFNQALFFIFLIFVTYIICILLSINSIYYKCIPAFIVGCLFALYYKNIKLFLMRIYLSSFCFIGVIVFLVGVGKLGNNLIKAGLYSIALCVSIIYFSDKIKITSRAITWLSTISYELYLIHGLVIVMCKKSDNYLSIFVIIIISLILATGLSFVSKRILRTINLKYMK